MLYSKEDILDKATLLTEEKFSLIRVIDERCKLREEIREYNGRTYYCIANSIDEFVDSPYNYHTLEDLVVFDDAVWCVCGNSPYYVLTIDSKTNKPSVVMTYIPPIKYAEGNFYFKNYNALLSFLNDNCLDSSEFIAEEDLFY